jgi:hypothetical protein
MTDRERLLDELTPVAFSIAYRTAPFKRRGRQQHEKMGRCLDISKNDALEVASGYARVEEEHVVAVVGQILEDG